MDDQIVRLCVDSFHTNRYDNDDYNDDDDDDDDCWSSSTQGYGQSLIFTDKLNTKNNRWIIDECIYHQSHGYS